MKWTFAGFMIAASLCPVFATGADLRVDTTVVSGPGVAPGKSTCGIKVLDAYFWRDFMPIVSRPGPDGGSPLRARVRLRIDNTTGADDKLSFRAVIVDEKGQPHPAAFRVEQRGGVWGGEVKASEVRENELITDGGPYLRVGSGVHCEITWTDRKGDSVIVRTPVGQINRTD